MPDENNDTTPELTLDSIVEIEPADLTEEQKTFLNENKTDLTDEQKTKYGIEEEEEEIDVEKLEPEVRSKKEKEEEEESGEEDEIAPEDEKVIGKVVSKKLKSVEGLRNEVQALKDEREVDSYLRVKPELEKYRSVALKYMAHPAYANIPAHNIFSMVAAKDLVKIGATKEREAQAQADKTKGTGTQVRKSSPGETDWQTASKEEFDAQKSRVLGQS